MRRRGLTLLEVLVALAVLGLGVTALQQLVAQSLGSLASDAEATRALAVARSLLVEATLAPPEPGTQAGERAGLRFERQVVRALHPALREVRVRVFTPDGGTFELVEVMRVPLA